MEQEVGTIQGCNVEQHSLCNLQIMVSLQSCTALPHGAAMQHSAMGPAPVHLYHNTLFAWHSF